VHGFGFFFVLCSPIMPSIAIVTGASSGIGREFALQLSKFFNVDEIWLVARRRGRLEELAAAITNRSGAAAPRPVVIEADLSHPAGVAFLAARLDREKPELRLLVNNAGYGTYGAFADTEKDFQLGQIDLNCRALTDLSWTALRHMGAGGRIVNVASLAAFSALGNFAVYAATKAYVLSFSAGLAAELAPRKIKVTALCPGSVSTEFAAVASGGARQEVQHGHPADKVVRLALRHARRGKFLSVYAADWKLSAFLSRFAGRTLVARLSARFHPRPQARSAQPE
jgi:short-subunit dehydrogenase